MACRFFLIACSRQESGEQASESDLVSRAKAIHERVLTLDAHIDIEDSFFTPEMPDRIGYQKLARLPDMKSGGLDGAFFTAYVEQGPLTDKGYAAAHDLAIAKVNRIRHVAEWMRETLLLDVPHRLRSPSGKS